MKDLAPHIAFDWIDANQYPFQSRFFNSGEGRMHYVDEGHGAPIVLVHGTPTWSFLYRHLIAGLSRRYRVIAIDHLGFGLSEKPAGATYRPADHARRLANLLACLDLDPITLVVHDFGGPIGLSYAIAQPWKVRSLVLFNTWMWSLADHVNVRRVSRLAASPLGALLYRGLNVSPRLLLPMVYGDQSKLTPEIHRHYVQAFASRKERMGPWVLARELVGSNDWYASLWERRAVLATKPALLLWGLKDPTFGPDALSRWEAALPLAESVPFADAGHFVQEEVGPTLTGYIASFLRTRGLSEPSAA
jgi:pimeloyl-ACP methyl ester carboxylesterase